jgi:hypothetical protein
MFKPMRWSKIAVVAGGCAIIAAVPPVDAGNAASAPWVVWEKQTEIEKKPIRLFPDAVQVRLFISVDEMGFHYVPGQNVPYEVEIVSAKGRHVNVPKKLTLDDGTLLSAADVAELKNSVYYTIDPPAVPACIFPMRYAFLFSNRAGQALGALLIDKDDRYPRLVPANPPDRKHDFLAVDRDIIRAIIGRYATPQQFAAISAMRSC